MLYNLQHIGYCVPPQADAGRIGEAGPGASYGDELPDGTLVGLSNEFTQRNTTFMTWNLLHLARMPKNAGGFPDYGNQCREWNGTPVPLRLAQSRVTPNLTGRTLHHRPNRGRRRELMIWRDIAWSTVI